MNMQEIMRGIDTEPPITTYDTGNGGGKKGMRPNEAIAAMMAVAEAGVNDRG